MILKTYPNGNVLKFEGDTFTLVGFKTRKLGILKGDTIFIGDKKENHYMRRVQGWGFNDDLLTHGSNGDKFIEFLDLRTKQHYRLACKDIKEKGYYIDNIGQNNDEGTQLFLQESKAKEINKSEMKPTLF